MSESSQPLSSPDAVPGSTSAGNSLEAFVRVHLRGFALDEITESTVGLLTASAFFAGAAEILSDPVQGDDPDTGLSALMARFFRLDPANAAGLVAAVGRMRARYQYMEDAHQAGVGAARQWRGEQSVSAAALRELVLNSKNISMIDLGQFGLKDSGQGVDAGRAIPPSGHRFDRGRRRRVLFWVAAAVLVAVINACLFLVLNRS